MLQILVFQRTFLDYFKLGATTFDKKKYRIEVFIKKLQICLKQEPRKHKEISNVDSQEVLKILGEIKILEMQQID
jgi:hypothetical protein